MKRAVSPIGDRSFFAGDSISSLRRRSRRLYAVWTGAWGPRRTAGAERQGGCMTLAGPRLIRLLLGLAIVAASMGSQPAAASTGSSGQTRMVSASGSGGITAGSLDSTTGVSAWETPGADEPDHLRPVRNRPVLYLRRIDCALVPGRANDRHVPARWVGRAAALRGHQPPGPGGQQLF